jgi:mercuric ion transport protein
MNELNAEEKAADGFWKRHLDKIGVGGALFAALCCLGFPALLSILSAIGLGFLVNDAILLPLLIVFLLATIAGLWAGMRHHGSRLALVVGSASAAALIGFVFVWFNSVLAGLSIAGLVVASGLNVWLRVRQRRCETLNAPNEQPGQ